MIWRFVIRVLAIGFGFAFAILAGIFVLFALGMNWAAAEVANNVGQSGDDITHVIDEGLGMFIFFVTVGQVLTLIPAISVALVGELARIRSAFYYIAAGGAAAAVMPFLLSGAGTATEGGYSVEYFAILATAGFAGGLVYWLVAGRKA